ncbi:serine/threonine-protein kinase [Chiayiivirga flava]|uniref:Serine/threonine-protein kinase n=1 Tax=Chiayiivirga flava TaxID=659595 RepID=A0A7W8FZ88_9GAMM|nr:serine/threonine-protein kinase [Chiayiivirga flava]MBB5208177.1 serine/threonine-protein kinase [Chiayiivirga flava]
MTGDARPLDPTLRVLFEGALEQPPPMRAAWLAAHCADAGVRARVERMLDWATHSTGEALPLARLEELADAIGVPAPPPGTRIGPFELLDTLGEGGYATVFRAVRESAGVRQHVALKLLRHGVYTAHAQRQFRHERQALAHLRHPNIARLIEGGVTDTGLAYIALELVDGVPITQYARERRLDLRARLTLMLQVCRAVEAAHQALIVHRDLKPSNVLVTADGRVQLLDFGIAKLLAADDETQTRAPGFTPAYAAPEQRRNEAITTATDVYSLGVLLGELATGQRLNDGSRSTPSAHVSQTTEPGVLPAPPRITRRQLRGDLDNIVLKAIEAEPARRYATAGALADDIERHLAGRPVAAHPPSRIYRARKFVARHKGGVASTIAFTLAVFAALGIALWQAGVARSQVQRAGEVQAFVEALFEPLETGNQTDSSPSVRDLVQRGLERLDGRHPHDVRVRADLLGLFARINDGMGEASSNLDLAHDAWQANAQAFGHDDVRTLRAQVLYGIVLRKVGRFDDALQTLAAARDAMQARGIAGLDYARALDAHANARMEKARIPDEEAIAIRRESLRVREADPAATPDDIAVAWNNLGGVLEGARRYEEAADAFHRAYTLRHDALGDSVPAALSLANVGSVYTWTGDWRKSLAIMEQARAMYERAGTVRHPHLAALLVRMCDLYTLLQQLDAAHRACDAGSAMTLAAMGPDHNHHGMVSIRRALLALARGDDAAAAQHFVDARAHYARIGGTPDAQKSRVDLHEAARWRLLRQYVPLRDALRDALQRPGSAAHPAAPALYAWLALACAHAPDPSCGDTRRADAERSAAEARYAHSPHLLAAQTALAELDLRDGDAPRAVGRLERALADTAADATLPPDHAWIGEALLLLAQAHTQAGDDALAAAAHAQAQDILAALPAGHALRASVRGTDAGAVATP